jgi:hypothetical protein
MATVFGDEKERVNGAADMSAAPQSLGKSLDHEIEVQESGAMGIRTPDLFHAMDAYSV